jgi:hypothetical protein
VPQALGGEGQPAPVGARIASLTGPIDELLVDAQDAQSTWRVLQPLAKSVIDHMRRELEEASQEGGIDLNAAQKLLTTISTCAKSFASASGMIVQSFERLVELQRTLGGAGRDLDKLSEADLRRIVLGVARTLEPRMPSTPVDVTP